MNSGTLGAAGSLAATGLPGTAGTACKAGTTAGRVGAGLGVGGGGGGGVAEEGTGSLLGKLWEAGGGGGRVLGGGGGGRLVVGGGGGLLVWGGGGGLLDGGGGGGLLVVGGGGGLLVVGGGGGGLLLTGAGAGLLLTGAGLLIVEGTGLLEGFCSTFPTMVLAGVPMEDPSLIAGLPLFLRSRNLSSSSVAGADCGPLKAGALIGPWNNDEVSITRWSVVPHLECVAVALDVMTSMGTVVTVVPMVS